MKRLRILIANTDYWSFLDDLYRSDPGLEAARYETQLKARAESLFGVADFYSWNLRELGHEARDVYVNNEILQDAWARESGALARRPDARSRSLTGRIMGRVRRSLGRYEPPLSPWLTSVFVAQVRGFQPDVLLNQAMETVTSEVLSQIRPHVGVIVGQIASDLPAHETNYQAYDLVISSLPNLVVHFRSLGVNAQLHRLGFDPRVLRRVEKSEKRFDVSFIGSRTQSHSKRERWLAELASRVPGLRIWGHGFGDDVDPVILSRYQGEAWGEDMYRRLSESRVTLNMHARIAGVHANNMRLYEATGVGTTLITDRKSDLHELFDVGKEVLAFDDVDECIELIQVCLADPTWSSSIGDAGQRRTLEDHSYRRRMEEFEGLLGPWFS